MTYFNENPFASNLIQPFTRTQANAFHLPPTDVSAFQGMRFSGINETGFSRVVVTLTWYDDLAQAQAPTAFNNAGIRNIIIDTADEAYFTLPHLGDWLTVDLVSMDAGQFALNWAMANRQNGIEQWIPGNLGVLVFLENQNIAGTVVPVPNTILSGRYAGPAVAWGQGPNNSYDIILQYLGLDNVWHNIAVLDSQSGSNDILSPKDILIPPCPLRLDIHNNGAAGNFSVTIIADDWRMA